MKVCYILSYKSPSYVRTESIVSALGEIDEVQLFEARNTSKGFKRYWETLIKLLKVRFSENPDVYILGFRGHEIYPFVRLLTLGKKLILDEMMSPTMGLIEENRIPLLNGTGIPSMIKWIEKLILITSDAVITDTQLHVEAIQDFFNLRDGKTKYVYVGTDEKKFYPSKEVSKAKYFTVFTYSNFLPLHGMEIVAEAATIVDKKTNGKVKFLIVGGKGRENSANYQKFKKILDRYNSEHIEHIKWLDYSKFTGVIHASSLCLGGPFGGSKQASRVITGKTYQFLASGKPTVIGKIDENVGFKDGKNCYIVEQENAEDLARKIIAAYNNRSIENVGRNGYNLFENTFSTTIISKQIYKIINEINE